MLLNTERRLWALSIKVLGSFIRFGKALWSTTLVRIWKEVAREVRFLRSGRASCSPVVESVSWIFRTLRFPAIFHSWKESKSFHVELSDITYPILKSRRVKSDALSYVKGGGCDLVKAYILHLMMIFVARLGLAIFQYLSLATIFAVI